jgi:hypothetical protein
MIHKGVYLLGVLTLMFFVMGGWSILCRKSITDQIKKETPSEEVPSRDYSFFRNGGALSTCLSIFSNRRYSGGFFVFGGFVLSSVSFVSSSIQVIPSHQQPLPSKRLDGFRVPPSLGNNRFP